MSLVVEELDAADAVVAFGDLRAERDAAERNLVLLAAHFADLHAADHDSASPSARGGRERATALGAGGPLIREFAVAEMAAELQLTCASARRLLLDAVQLRARFPRVWSRLCDGEALAGRARKVAQATRDLTGAAAGVVDQGIVEVVDGRVPFSRFMGILEGLVVAADPEAAAAAERRAASERFAKVGQSNDHGQKTLYVKTSAAEMARIEATIAHIADLLAAMGDPGTLDERRTKAVLVLANPHEALALLQAYATARANGQAGERPGAPAEPPAEEAEAPADNAETSADEGGASDHPHTGPPGLARFFEPFRPSRVPPCPCRGGQWDHDSARLLPTVMLYLHVHADTLRRGDGVVRWEGEGPVTWGYVREHLGPHARFVVKGAVDPERLAPVDAYEVPARHREALHLRTPADVFPFAACTSRKKQVDHTKAYRRPEDGGPAGQTGLHNLGGMTPFHHRVKTHAGWQVAQPFPGIYIWRSPHGAIFAVDNTGTRQLRRPQRTGRHREATRSTAVARMRGVRATGSTLRRWSS